MGVELIQVAPCYPVVIAGNSAEIMIDNTHPGATYALVAADNDQNVISVEPVAGTGKTISLLTEPLERDTTLRIRTTSRSGRSKTCKKDILVEILRTNFVPEADKMVFSGDAA